MRMFRILFLLAVSGSGCLLADLVVPPKLIVAATAPEPETLPKESKPVSAQPVVQEKKSSMRVTGVGRARYTRLALHAANVNAAYRALCSFLGEKTVEAQGVDKVYDALDAVINRDDYGDYRIEEQVKKGRFYNTTITRTVELQWLLSKVTGLPELHQKLQEVSKKCTH